MPGGSRRLHTVALASGRLIRQAASAADDPWLAGGFDDEDTPQRVRTGQTVLWA